MKRFIGGLLLGLLLTGCPANRESSGGGLVLSADSQAAGVGSSATLRLTLQPGAEGTQLFGALMASEPARLTTWHAEPAGAVEFQECRAVFRAAGPVKVWATWTDAGGNELRSNELTFKIE